MASFTNLALSLSQLGTKYLNQLYTITREVRDERTLAIITAPNYSELGALLITVTIIGLVVPMIAIVWARTYTSQPPTMLPAPQPEWQGDDARVVSSF